jgi:hypothetical protein
MVKGVGEVIFPSQTGGPCLLSSIDFVSNYVRPGPVMNQDIQLLRHANADLYARIRSGTDEYLLSKTAETGVLEPDEIDTVRALRAIRDFCCHFNPYSATIMRYKEALQKLRIKPAESISDFSITATSVLEITSDLLETWKQRRNQLCQRCYHEDHKISRTKVGYVLRGDWLMEEIGGAFAPDAEPMSLRKSYACKVRICSNWTCKRFEINSELPLAKPIVICRFCKRGLVKDVTITSPDGDDAQIRLCSNAKCDWYTSEHK